MKIYRVNIDFDPESKMFDDLSKVHLLFLGVDFSGFRICRFGWGALNKNKQIKEIGSSEVGEVGDGGYRHRAFPFWLIRIDDSVPYNQVYFDRSGDVSISK